MQYSVLVRGRLTDVDEFRNIVVRSGREGQITRLKDVACVEGSAPVWSFGGRLTQPIFTAGRVRNQVARAEAIERQSLYQYQRSIISAFEDVENALADRSKFTQSRAEQAANVGALKRFRDFAEIRYKGRGHHFSGARECAGTAVQR